MVTRYFVWAGGRKTGLGLLGALILIVMALVLGASFEAFAGALLLCLGITQGTVAWEDSRRPEWATVHHPLEVTRNIPEAATHDDIRWPSGHFTVHETDREAEERAIAERAVARTDLERRARRSY